MKKVFCCLVALVLCGCSAVGDTPQQKRDYIQNMKQQTLSEFYQKQAGLRKAIARAKGYAVFSSTNNHLFVMSAGSGFGLAHDNSSGRDTYMRMATVGMGLGVGLKDFRTLIIFQDRQALQRFLSSGWDLGGQADLAARAGDKGADLVSGAVASDLENVKVYQLTKNGVVAQATLQGYKYWPDSELN